MNPGAIFLTVLEREHIIASMNEFGDSVAVKIIGFDIICHVLY